VSDDTSKPVKSVAKKVPAKKAPRHAPPVPEEPPKPFLRDGVWYEPVWLVRFLMADGEIIDVKAITDDSRLREAILNSRGKGGKANKDDRIAGSSRVEFLGYADLTMIEMKKGA
jgi:hypothetical protein